MVFSRRPGWTAGNLLGSALSLFVPTNFQSLTNCSSFAKLFEPLCFQSLPTIKFCKPSVLITIRIAGDGSTPLAGVLRSLFLSLQSSVYSSKFRILQLLCFHTLHKTAGVGVYSSQIGTPSMFHLQTFKRSNVSPPVVHSTYQICPRTRL